MYYFKIYFLLEGVIGLLLGNQTPSTRISILIRALIRVLGFGVRTSKLEEQNLRTRIWSQS
jgi:hypothetical protein